MRSTMWICILLLFSIAMANAEDYSGEQTTRIGKRIYKCKLQVRYSTFPELKCQGIKARCRRNAKKRNLKFSNIRTHDAVLSVTVRRNRIKSCNVEVSKSAVFHCVRNPMCRYKGCNTGCCLDGYCCPCPTIINPPKEDICNKCTDNLECPLSCPYCGIKPGELEGPCFDDAGLKEHIHMNFASEIGNLTTSNLAEFQSSHSECSWWRCGFEVMKTLYHCYKECKDEKDCIVPCAKQILQRLGDKHCWPCIQSGCCKLNLLCCDTNKEVFMEISGSSKDLVIVGGNNQKEPLSSSNILTSSGVCSPGNPRPIPPLLHPTTAGGLAWMKSNDTGSLLVFCGGSQTFVPGTGVIQDYGATKLCYSLKPNSNQWSTVALCGSTGCGPHHQNDMHKARSWFSLTSVNDNPGELIAVGGLDNAGNIHKSIEKYSYADETWALLPYELANPRFGHCAVHYSTGGNSYLILIGGSEKVPNKEEWNPVKTVEQIDLVSNTITRMNNLPEALWGPACTVSNGFIYVSGGSRGSRKEAQTGVYRYSFSTKEWSPSPIGHLNHPRWGHVMGTTFDGPFGQLIVTGGFNPSRYWYYKSVERSTNGGFMWKRKQPDLNGSREYASVASVAPGTFTC